MNTYTYTFCAICPNNGEAIIYELEMRSPDMIMVEHIKTACALHRRGFHEPIAADLHRQFPQADLRLVAVHHGVRIETVLARRA